MTINNTKLRRPIEIANSLPNAWRANWMRNGTTKHTKQYKINCVFLIIIIIIIIIIMKPDGN